MQNELEKICPILHASKYDGMSKCIGEKCAWWCGFAECCAIPLNDQEYFVERGEDFYCSYGEKK